jgi:HAD superfamily hydrolase (TIGR01509 family)
MPERRLRALIFDLDGTLVDSRLDFAAMRQEIGAPHGIGLLEYIDTLSSIDERQSAMAVIHRHENAGALAATWMPGAEVALAKLHRRQTPIAIVTRNSREAARRTMERLGIPPIPLMAREDAPPKPHPGALLAIAGRWQIEPAHCAYIGDFRYDIEAARRAGMLPVLYVGTGEIPAEYHGTGDETLRILRDFSTMTDWLAQEGI